jgi:hypothetical protein
MTNPEATAPIAAARRALDHAAELAGRGDHGEAYIRLLDAAMLAQVAAARVTRQETEGWPLKEVLSTVG